MRNSVFKGAHLTQGSHLKLTEPAASLQDVRPSPQNYQQLIYEAYLTKKTLCKIFGCSTLPLYVSALVETMFFCTQLSWHTSADDSSDIAVDAIADLRFFCVVLRGVIVVTQTPLEKIKICLVNRQKTDKIEKGSRL